MLMIIMIEWCLFSSFAVFDVKRARKLLLWCEKSLVARLMVLLLLFYSLFQSVPQNCHPIQNGIFVKVSVKNRLLDKVIFISIHITLFRFLLYSLRDLIAVWLFSHRGIFVSL